MPPQIFDLAGMSDRLRQFAVERDWEQFHTPKNLAMALAGEAGELVEIFQWLGPEESFLRSDPDTRHNLADELADVLQYLIRIADLCDVDLAQSLEGKLDANEARYPANLIRGSAMKRPPLRGSD